MSPQVSTLSENHIKDLIMDSPLELADMLAAQQPTAGLYPGKLGLFLTFGVSGLQHYQFVLGGQPDKWNVSMQSFQGLPNYSEELNDHHMIVEFNPSMFHFLPDAPHSPWVKLWTCNTHVPDITPDNLALQAVLVRLRVSRPSKGEYQLILEGILEHDTFTIETANKSQWCRTVKAAPVALYATEVDVSHNHEFAMEIMPAVKSLDPLPAAVSDSSLRFATLKAAIESSSASWTASLIEWISHARLPKHQWPANLFDDVVIVPLTQFTPPAGISCMTIRVDGEFYQVNVGSTDVIKVDGPPPPSYQQAVSTSPPTSSVPSLTRAPATTDPSSMAPPSQQGAGVAPVTDQPAASGSIPGPPGAQPQVVNSVSDQPPSVASGKKRHYTRTPLALRKPKYSPHPLMSNHLMPGLPPLVAESLQMAFASNSQERMISAYKQFVKALGGRCPFLNPQPYDAILCLEYFFSRKLSPKTVANYMGSFTRWSDLNGLPVKYKALVSLAMRGYSNGYLSPIKMAAEGFKLPFSFSTLKLICNGLVASSLHPTIQAAVWAVTLLTFWGLLRIGEILCEKAAIFDVTTDLCLADISFLPDGNMKMWVKGPKCTPKVHGYHGDIIEFIQNTSIPQMCPVAALKNYLRFRANITAAVDKPLFLNPSGTCLTPMSFARYWKLSLRLANVPQSIIQQHTNHGLRASLPSLLQLANMPKDKVKVLGRWASDQAYSLYLKNTKARAEAKQEAMAFCQQLLSAHSACKCSTLT